jgi:hypothetical protein
MDQGPQRANCGATGGAGRLTGRATGRNGQRRCDCCAAHRRADRTRPPPRFPRRGSRKIARIKTFSAASICRVVSGTLISDRSDHEQKIPAQLRITLRPPVSMPMAVMFDFSATFRQGFERQNSARKDTRNVLGAPGKASSRDDEFWKYTALARFLTLSWNVTAFIPVSAGGIHRYWIMPSIRA